jgi:hypothetical protein
MADGASCERLAALAAGEDIASSVKARAKSKFELKQTNVVLNRYLALLISAALRGETTERYYFAQPDSTLSDARNPTDLQAKLLRLATM